MESTMLSSRPRTPCVKCTPSPRPLIHLKRPLNSSHSSPSTPPTPPEDRISWFHGRLTRRNGHEITKAAAARMTRKQLVDADWEKQKKELLEVATEENAPIINKLLEVGQDESHSYDPNAKPSIPVPMHILFPKTPKISKHMHSPLHQFSKASASQIRNDLVKNPSRRQSKVLVFEGNHAVNELISQTPSKATPTQSMNWEATSVKSTADTLVVKLERDIRTMKAELRELRRKLGFATHRNKELEAAARNPLGSSRVFIKGERIKSSFFTKNFFWFWTLVPETSSCYIIFHVLCYCARSLEWDSAM